MSLFYKLLNIEKNLPNMIKSAEKNKDMFVIPRTQTFQTIIMKILEEI